MNNSGFTFEISLSVLNHLGRNLYRSFATILGEGVSNSWDADAENVWIYIDEDKSSFFIKDDGLGMTAADFQRKFLKIGYSKRRDGEAFSPKGRPYIGRKGIGKLALLSCADKIHVISKTVQGDYVGGIIDNSGLDEAISDDLTPGEYRLGEVDSTVFQRYTQGHEQGTIIYFENIKDGIRNSLPYLRKIIALYFRFSLLDETFSIFLDGDEITLEDLRTLAEKTDFLWNINGFRDPFIDEKLTTLRKPVKAVEMSSNVKGFIASVIKPRYLKVIGTDERASVDLFVNGRMRERDILRHIPTDRLAESYLYGQIHFDTLDDEVDRFATGREGIIAEDQKYREFLNELRKRIISIVGEWDKWRHELKKTGDPESERITPRERASTELYNAVVAEYEPPEDSPERIKVDHWVEELKADALFNFESYADCFISENLTRNYIREKGIPPDTQAQNQVQRWRDIEVKGKRKGGLSIEIRHSNDDLFYLDMERLAGVADPPKPGDGHPDRLHSDEKQFTPIRNAVMHTARLTEDAKHRLRAVYENIKARIKALLSS